MLTTAHNETQNRSIVSFGGLSSYLIARREVDGEEIPEEESRHVVQDEAVQRQVQRCDPRLLLLERQQAMMCLKKTAPYNNNHKPIHWHLYIY